MNQGGFNLGNLMNQMQNMKNSVEKIKKELENKTVEGSAGGGVVKAIATGNLKLRKVMISSELITENDKEMLEELVVAAVNDAFTRAEELSKKEMSSFAGSLGLPLDGLL